MGVGGGGHANHLGVFTLSHLGIFPPRFYFLETKSRRLLLIYKGENDRNVLSFHRTFLMLVRM